MKGDKKKLRQALRAMEKAEKEEYMKLLKIRDQRDELNHRVGRLRRGVDSLLRGASLNSAKDDQALLMLLAKELDFIRNQCGKYSNRFNFLRGNVCDFLGLAKGAKTDSDLMLLLGEALNRHDEAAGLRDQRDKTTGRVVFLRKGLEDLLGAPYGQETDSGLMTLLGKALEENRTQGDEASNDLAHALTRALGLESSSLEEAMAGVERLRADHDRAVEAGRKLAVAAGLSSFDDLLTPEGFQKVSDQLLADFKAFEQAKTSFEEVPHVSSALHVKVRVERTPTRVTALLGEHPYVVNSGGLESALAELDSDLQSLYPGMVIHLHVQP